MKFYTTATLGPKQSLTPEGYLLCEDVPIARTGEMLYLPHECGLPPGPDGYVRVTRSADDLFAPTSVASFAGKSFTIDHPPKMLRVTDHRHYTNGHVLHPRRGDGDLSEWLVCDILVTSAEAIRAIRDEGIREVSAGYDAGFFKLNPPVAGRGIQKNIIGNHVALVPAGRCGATCAVGDKAVEGQRSIWDSFKSFLTGDPEQMARENFRRMIEEAAAVAVRDALPPAGTLETRVATLEAQLASTEARAVLAETSLAELRGELGEVRMTADAAVKAAEKPAEPVVSPAPVATAPVADAAPTDLVAAPTAQEWLDVASRAEVLAPGFRAPVLDAAADPKTARDALCQMRRAAMGAALANDASRDALAPFGVRDAASVARMTCDAAAAAFVGASEVLSIRNNARVVDRSAATATPKGQPTADELNERHRAFWAAR